MEIILLGITVVSLVVALVMSVAAWRLMRDEKQRSAARVAALSVAAASTTADGFAARSVVRAAANVPRIVAARRDRAEAGDESAVGARAFDSPARSASRSPRRDMPLNQPRARFRCARVSPCHTRPGSSARTKRRATPAAARSRWRSRR